MNNKKQPIIRSISVSKKFNGYYMVDCRKNRIYFEKNGELEFSIPKEYLKLWLKNKLK